MYALPRSTTVNLPGAIFLLPLLLFFSGGIFSSAFAADHATATSPTVEQQGQHGGILVTRGQDILYSHNAAQQFVPASTLKILTALMAVETLGHDFRFITDFFLDAQDNLFIKGYGDPLLVSSEVEDICQELAAGGMTTLNGIFLDSSAFALEPEEEGKNRNGRGTSLNPYDAANDALVVNFNSVKAKIRHGKVIASAEKETPTLPFMRHLPASGMLDGVDRINISANPDASWHYVGELFREFLGRHGVTVSGTIACRKTPESARRILRHENSHSLAEVITGMFRYSNNFTANQLFLVAGAKEHGFPATWDKSRRLVRDFMHKRLGITETEAKVVEGSGLSRENRLSPAVFDKVLEQFSPYAALLPQENGYRLKSGTLKGVYSYAGYFGDMAPLTRVVILLNQHKNTRDAVLSRLDALIKPAPLH